MLSPCDRYRNEKNGLYLSQGREKNPISYIVVFLFPKKNSPILRYRTTFFALYYDIGVLFLPYITIFRYRGKKKKLYKGYRSFFRVPVTNIGMKKMAYIGHRNEAQPSSCGQYRPFFEFLYLSQGRNIWSYIRYSYFLVFL